MSTSNKIFSFFCDWKKCPDELLASSFAEILDNGVSNFVFGEIWMERILQEPKFVATLRHLAGNRVKFHDMHAPYGECYDLACPGTGRRDELIKDHIRALAYASDFGCRTYTIHIGAYDSVFFHTPNEVIRPLALESLEKLVPWAEKYGVILAVENAFERSNTPDEVMYYVDYFDHPYVKCCFDSGHALIMDTYPGKGEYGDYMKNDVWSGKVENYTGAFEKMSPLMVTCHLHDNDGFSDQHKIPGDGIEKWDILAGKLLNNAPELLSIQTESVIWGYGISITKTISRFREIFPGLF
ncbi:MAG: sugar phosphate isomerase/epimerase [Lentisphaeria bacterium]|nr:sugar phosphate isomerase/epimerase [Lentisphaeria bacterium]